jgi:hypothetical protein
MASGSGEAGRLSIDQVCAVAYTLLTDRVESYAVASFTAASIALAFGGEGDLPDPDAARVEFDRALAAEPVLVDSDQHVLLSALGLGG